MSRWKLIVSPSELFSNAAWEDQIKVKPRCNCSTNFARSDLHPKVTHRYGIALDFTSYLNPQVNISKNRFECKLTMFHFLKKMTVTNENVKNDLDCSNSYKATIIIYPKETRQVRFVYKIYHIMLI